MGYIRHHGFLVTGGDWSAEAATIAECHTAAVNIFGPAVSPLSPKATNGYQSFAVFPDGSKEGWEESDAGDEQRQRFIAWLRERAVYSDGSRAVSWVEVQYGDDELHTVIVDDSDAPARRLYPVQPDSI